MATRIQQRRGTAAQHDNGSGFTGAEGELTVDTTNDTVRVHDGSLKGGHVMAKLSDVQASDTLSELSDTSITSTAAGHILIHDGSDSFDNKAVSGAITINSSGVTTLASGQALTNLGGGSGSTFLRKDGTFATPSNTNYSIQDGELSQNNFTDADHSKLNAIEASADVTDTTNVVAALTAGTNISIANNGTITSTDTNTTYSVQDGELSQNNFTNADHTKLNGIEASADVTDATNVVAALTAGTNIAIANNGTISSTDTNTTFLGGTGLTLSGTTFNVDAAQTGITSLGTLTGLTAGATIVNGLLTVNNDTLKLTSTTASSGTENPALELYRNGGSGSGQLGAVKFFGNNNAGTPEKFEYAGIYADVQVATDGSEQGALKFSLGTGGAQEDPAMSLFSYGLQMGYGNPILMSYSNGYQQFFSPNAAQKSFKVNATPNATVANGAYDIYLPDVAGGTLVAANSDKALTAGATTVNGSLSVNSTTADTSYSPEIVLERNGGAAAGDDGDKLGVITFKGDNTSGTQAVYAQIGARIVNDGVDNADTKGEIRIACGYNNTSNLEDPVLRIDHKGLHINESAVDGSSNANFYNVAGGQGGLKFWASNASSGFATAVQASTPTANRTIKLPDVTGTVVVAGVAGGSVNGGGGLGTAKTAWTPAQFLSNANTDYYHYTASGTDVDLVVGVPYSGIDLGADKFGSKFTFRNISAEAGSKITIDLNGFTSSSSQGQTQYYSINKYDGSTPSLITSAASDLVISVGGVIEMIPISAAVWYITGVGFA